MISKTIINQPVITSFFLAMIIITAINAGCASKNTLTLMPTPVLYQNARIDPFAHLPKSLQTTHMKVFYATNRMPVLSKTGIKYKNKFDSALRLGRATIHMGDQGFNWEQLLKHSIYHDENKPVAISLGNIEQIALIQPDQFGSDTTLTPELQAFMNSINAEIAMAVDKEIMVYVHGTKVDFDNAVVLTSEIDHFAGRDFVSLAFAWPSHQNIISYLLGIDVDRAINSSVYLQALLTLLSTHTDAEHINILCYSAGGRVTSRALSEIRQRFDKMDATALRKKFRFGSIVFAAADVEVDKFLERLSDISELADQVVITMSDNDNALKAAKRFMGGKYRAGTLEAEPIEEEYIVSHHLTNVEIIDVSMGQQVRGFDITGHHYWYRHPWMSSDIIFLMRTDLPPHRRGLSQSELEGIWYLSPEYPEKIQAAAAIELNEQW